MVMMIVGIIGTILCVGAYGLLTLERIAANSIAFYGLNLVGAVMLLVSIAYDFDWGDLGGVLIEVCWIVISVFGILRFVCGKTKEHENG